MFFDGECMPTTVDYNFEYLNEMFKIDEDSPSGLAFNTTVYGGRNNKQQIRKPGQPAGSKAYTKIKNGTKVPLAWRVHIHGQNYQAHRVIWILNNGEISNDMVIDHVDGNPFNNSLSNLALKTVRENNQNLKLPSNNTSGVCGVFLEKSEGFPIAWTATWSDLDSKPNRKRFYFKQYDKQTAFALAVQFREQKIKELKCLGMNYTDRHGK